jgi:hypothetical protein
MQVDIPFSVENLITLVGFAGAVVYQSAVLRNSLKFLTERMEKIELDVSKITDILISQEKQSVRLDSLTARMDRHEHWHEDNDPNPYKPRRRKNITRT